MSHDNPGSRPLLSVVLPCYNEAPNLPGILRRFWEVGMGRRFEVILVDNGSRDHTEITLKTELQNPLYGFARTVTVPVNQGYGHGIAAGLGHAKGDVLAWSHADLQCDPLDVFRAFDKLRSSADPRRTIVKGLRKKRALLSTITTIGMQSAARLVLHRPLRDINGQPKVFHRSLLGHLPRPPKDLSFDLYVLYRALGAGWRIRTVPVWYRTRPHGRSKWAFNARSRLAHVSAALRYMVRLRQEVQ